MKTVFVDSAYWIAILHEDPIPLRYNQNASGPWRNGT